MDALQLQFWILIAKSALLFCILLLSGFGTYRILYLLIKIEKFKPLLMGISLVIGPLLLSWILGLLLQFAPGQERYIYIFVPLLPFLPFALFGLGHIIRDLSSFIKNWIFVPKIHLLHLLLGLFVGGYILLSLGGLVFTNAVTPLYGNDAMEYSRLAQFLAEQRSTQNYPLIDNQISNGFVANWTHPLGYINLLVYGYILQGATDVSGVTRFVAPYFAFAMTILLIAFAGYGRRMSGLLSSFFFLTTPLFYGLVVQSHIDPTRIAGFCAAIASVWIVTQYPSFRAAVLAGIACGCSMFTHSIGLLTLVLALPIYILLVRQARLHIHLLNLATIVTISILMVLIRYLENLRIFGSVINDSVAIWTFPELEVEHTRVVTRFMETPLDRIYNGALMGFSNPSLFGWFYFLLLAALAFWAYTARKTWKSPVKALKAQAWRDSQDPIYAAFFVVLGYTGIMFLTLLTGTDLAVKNARYILTLQPFVIMVAVRVFALYLLNDTSAKMSVVHSEVSK